MTIQSQIETKLSGALRPVFLDVINESHMHHVPPGSESHFKVVVVADGFDGKTRVARHQSVNALLAEEIAGPVHALSIQAHTPEEWRARGGAVFASPDCLGGSKGG